MDILTFLLLEVQGLAIGRGRLKETYPRVFFSSLTLKKGVVRNRDQQIVSNTQGIAVRWEIVENPEFIRVSAESNSNGMESVTRLDLIETITVRSHHFTSLC